MNERQLKVCAIALFADGFSHEQIARALKVDYNFATELIELGASEQRRKRMGYMRSCPFGEDQIVVERDDEGNILKTVKRQ